MSEPPVLAMWHGKVCQLTLNRPAQGNALSGELVHALSASIDHTAANCSAIVLRGAGRHFCAGFDLSGIAAETDDTLLARFVRIELLLQRVARLPFPVAAVAQGRAAGAGADLFAACTLRLAEAGATFTFPGARGFGLVLGTRRLAALVGAGQALRWVESGSAITAPDALRAGLATATVHGPDDEATHIDSLAAHPFNTGLRAQLHRAARPHADADDAADLAALVRSATAPGLRERISAYTQVTARRQCADLPPHHSTEGIPSCS